MNQLKPLIAAILIIGAVYTNRNELKIEKMEEQKINYFIALVTISYQVTHEEWRTSKVSKRFHNSATINDVLEWANEHNVNSVSDIEFIRLQDNY